MKCPICGSKSRLIHNIEGYVQWTFYDIYACDTCDCHHMDMEKVDFSIYDKIYKNPSSVWWYSRYQMYMDKVQKEQFPLKRLSRKEDTYSPVYEFLKDKKDLNVLEIWCWLWYTTFAINAEGNKCIWMDISEESIRKANKKFWPYYKQGYIKDIPKMFWDKKFDVIFATELIEHINNFEELFHICISQLKSNGSLILTTPNKWFYSKSALWIWDLPPVHTIWLSAKSMIHLSKTYGLDITFYRYALLCNVKNYFGEWLYYFKKNILLSSAHVSENYIELNKQSNNNLNFLGRISNIPIIKKIQNLIMIIIKWNINAANVLWVIYTKK